MGIFDRVEAKLERAVNGAFARAFKSEVQPVEIASAVRRAMDDRAAIAGRGRTFVPNVFTIELAPSDYDRLADYEDDIADELIAAAQEHADSQRYSPNGAFQIFLSNGEDLETGVFRVRPSNARHTGTTGPKPRLDANDADHGDDPYAAGAAAAAAAPAGAPAPPPASASDRALPPTAEDAPVQQRPRPRRVNPADRPWLDIDGERYPLMGALTVLGRDDLADIILDDPGISRRHSEIRVTTDGPHLAVAIRDLGSTNGTFVNGERVTTTRLEDGDRVTVGRTTVTFRAGR